MLLPCALAEVTFVVAGQLTSQVGRLLRSLWLIGVIVFGVNLASYGTAGAALATVRLALLVTAFSSFFLSTDPDDLALALVRLHAPFTFAFVLAASSNYVPVVMHEAQEIMAAFEARGLDRGRTPADAFRFYAAILMPLTVGVVRRSLRLGEALEARAFGVSRKRTTLRQLRPGLSDWLLGVGTIAGIWAIVGLHARF